MSGYKHIQAYKSSFANVDKINQVIMLYDTAIASMQQARQAMVDKNIEERFNKLTKAFHIINGLHDSLDHDKGGDVASALSEWYSGTSLQILTLNRTENLDVCDMCIKHIKQMRDAWVDVEVQVKTSNMAGNESNDSEPEATSEEDEDIDNGSMEVSSKDDYFEQESQAITISAGMNISV